MKESAVYALRDVGKSYGADFSLSIDRLDIFKGETLALMGPTGAGKSTLLKLLAGLESPSSGEIQFEDGRAMSRDAPLALRRMIAMVHQWPALLRGSVRSNVEYGLRLRGNTSPQSAVDAAMEQLGLKALASRQARALSAGQTQLVGLARAIVVSPEVLLLDEPTANLDPAHVGLVEMAVREVQAKRRMTVVWATHNLFQARRVADRIAFLWNGQLIEAGETETIFERPGDSRTADFVSGRLVY